MTAQPPAQSGIAPTSHRLPDMIWAVGIIGLAWAIIAAAAVPLVIVIEVIK